MGATNLGLELRSKFQTCKWKHQVGYLSPDLGRRWRPGVIQVEVLTKEVVTLSTGKSGETVPQP